MASGGVHDVACCSSIPCQAADPLARRLLPRRPIPLLCTPCAVVKFARATGDIHALSSADVRLIALAHSIEASEGAGCACVAVRCMLAAAAGLMYCCALHPE